MARYTVGGVATIAGSATLPFVSLYSAASVNFRLREVHAYNTTATGGFVVALCRLSSTGTQGTGLTEVGLDASSTTASCTAFAGHTVGPTLADLGFRKRIGAAIGDGFIWVFNNDTGVNVNSGTANGIGLYVPTGTGQVMEYTLVWDE